MNLTKKINFHCKRIDKNVVLELTYTPSPVEAQLDFLTGFNCTNSSLQCGVIKETEYKSREYDWEVCPAHKQYT